MTDRQNSFEEDRIKAAELYAVARKLEVERDYDGAIRNYEQSLQLYEEEEVKTAYFELLATIGPL